MPEQQTKQTMTLQEWANNHSGMDQSEVFQELVTAVSAYAAHIINTTDSERDEKVTGFGAVLGAIASEDNPDAQELRIEFRFLSPEESAQIEKDARTQFITEHGTRVH